MGTWLNIEAGIKSLINTMTVANGYTYNYAYHERTDINHPDTVYLSLNDPEGEENLDEETGNFVGAGYFLNQRSVVIYCYLENDEGDLELDDIRENLKNKLELILVDLKRRFNGVIPDVLCAEDVSGFDYKTMTWQGAADGEEKAGIYTNTKMNVTFLCKYREARNV